MEKKTFESQLARFRHIQQSLRMIYGDNEPLHLSDTVGNEVGLNNCMSITEIPLQGDNVTLSVFKGDTEKDTVTILDGLVVPLATFSEEAIEKILNAMHGAMIIEEIRTHFM